MDLIQFYKSTLANASIRANAAGELNLSVKGCEISFQIDGNRVVLPTPEQVADKRGKTFFHPLRENVISAESPVVQQYRKALNIKLQFSICALISEILLLATSPSEHAKASIAQGDILVAAKDADETTMAKWKQLMAAIEKAIKTDDTKNRLVHTFLKRKGSVGDRTFSRVATVTFPFFEQLKTDEKQIFGVPLRRKDRVVFHDIFALIFPGVIDGTNYSYGTNSDIGPFFDAMLGAVIKLGERINAITDMMGSFISAPEDIKFDLDFRPIQESGYKELKDEILRSDTPAQNVKPLTPAQADAQRAYYNATAQPAPTTMLMTPVAPAAVQEAPVQAQAVQPHHPQPEKNTVVPVKSFTELMQSVNTPAAAPPMGAIPPGYVMVMTPQGPVLQPMPMMAAPMQQMPQQQMPMQMPQQPGWPPGYQPQQQAPVSGRYPTQMQGPMGGMPMAGGALPPGVYPQTPALPAQLPPQGMQPQYPMYPQQPMQQLQPQIVGYDASGRPVYQQAMMGQPMMPGQAMPQQMQMMPPQQQQAWNGSLPPPNMVASTQGVGRRY